MKILVTGATGRVGSRLVPRLAARGHHVRVLVRDQVAPGEGTAAAEAVFGDLLHPDTLGPAVADVDAVVHLAAHFRGQDSSRIDLVNVEGTRHLALAALAANPSVRMVFASTNLVYDNMAAPAHEDDPVAARAPYPQSKVAAEQFLVNLHASARLDLRVLRLAFVYGDGDPHLGEAGTLFERWSWHPASRLHLIHHADVAQAVILLLTTVGLDGQIFNVADDAPATAQEILALTDHPATLGDPARPLDSPWKNLVDTGRIRTIGFRPEFPSLYAAVADGRL